MKRGLITWDKAEIPPSVFDERIHRLRDFLSSKRLPALVVYSELWRSNPARFFSNYMPYFNRALLVLPLEGAPTLLCGLSPRVYSWIRSVTTIEDVQAGGKFCAPADAAGFRTPVGSNGMSGFRAVSSRYPSGIAF